MKMKNLTLTLFCSTLCTKGVPHKKSEPKKSITVSFTEIATRLVKTCNVELGKPFVLSVVRDQAQKPQITLETIEYVDGKMEEKMAIIMPPANCFTMKFGESDTAFNVASERILCLQKIKKEIILFEIDPNILIKNGKDDPVLALKTRSNREPLKESVREALVESLDDFIEETEKKNRLYTIYIDGWRYRREED